MGKGASALCPPQLKRLFDSGHASLRHGSDMAMSLPSQKLTSVPSASMSAKCQNGSDPHPVIFDGPSAGRFCS